MNFVATVQREPLTVLRCDLEYSIRIDAVGDSFLLCEADEFDLHFDFLLFCFVLFMTSSSAHEYKIFLLLC